MVWSMQAVNVQPISADAPKPPFRGFLLPPLGPNGFMSIFRCCMDAIINIAYVWIGIGDDKQSG